MSERNNPWLMGVLAIGIAVLYIPMLVMIGYSFNASPLVGVWAPKTPAAAVERIRELLPGEDYAAIAAKLNAEGFRAAKGLGYDERSVGYVARSRGVGRGRGRHGLRTQD